MTSAANGRWGTFTVLRLKPRSLAALLRKLSRPTLGMTFIYGEWRNSYLWGNGEIAQRPSSPDKPSVSTKSIPSQCHPERRNAELAKRRSEGPRFFSPQKGRLCPEGSPTTSTLSPILPVRCTPELPMTCIAESQSTSTEKFPDSCIHKPFPIIYTESFQFTEEPPPLHMSAQS